MPGYRVGVFRKRHHYRPNRRKLPFRSVPAAVVGTGCPAVLAGVNRAVIVMAAMEPDAGYIDYGREPFLLPGDWCRETV